MDWNRHLVELCEITNDLDGLEALECEAIDRQCHRALAAIRDRIDALFPV
jgi:hypothetical protein